MLICFVFSDVVDKHDFSYDIQWRLDEDDDYRNQFEIFPSRITCTGYESSLADCTFSTQSTTCQHDSTVFGLECQAIPSTSTVSTTVSTVSTSPSIQATTKKTTIIGIVTQDPKPIKERIPIQLVGGDAANIGRLEVRYNGTWGTVCSGTGWTEQNAQVVCHQLHYA